MNDKFIIENKDLDYLIFKDKNSLLEIEINLPIQGGLSVYHILEQNEIIDYKKKGILSLKDRITDMKNNYSNYSIISWR